MDLPWSLVMSSSGLAARTISMQSLRLLFPFFVSADPSEAKNLPNFLYLRLKQCYF
jgi:hypothetical protein